MTKFDSMVLGAGIIGVCTALHLQARGLNVLLVDRRPPGEGASYGNAGILERSSVIPYAFPRDIGTLARYASNRTAALHYDPAYIKTALPFLFRYWWHSSPRRLAVATRAMLPMIERSIEEHDLLVSAAGAQSLIRSDGWLSVWRSRKAFTHAIREAQSLSSYDLKYSVLDQGELSSVEPGLRCGFKGIIGAIHWRDPKTVLDPGELVKRYARLFEQRGGSIRHGDAATLKRDADLWAVSTAEGEFHAQNVVIALGAQSAALAARFGHVLPMGVKRGYHLHFKEETKRLAHTLVDEQAGFVLAPMNQGLRITTGVEIADPAAPPNEVQIRRAECVARTYLNFGDAIERTPWLGLRPCFPDMRPAIGALSSRDGLWVNFGHAHHGLTLGPASGRLLSEMMTGQEPFADPAAFRPDRFARNGRNGILQ